ncbi:MAG: oligopeptide transporter permease protein [Symbiobacteriaceae bacterium]|nr:oligopeptide transporter permease protein [Symbiobacteriaceae bacterium]
MAVPKENNENEVQDRSLANKKDETQLRAIARRFFRNKAAVVGVCILFVFYMIAIFAPLLAPFELDFLDPTLRRLPPLTPGHLLRRLLA